MTKHFKINDKSIGTSCSPYLIAEISGNHLQDLDRSLLLVKKAHESGADAVKLQTIDPSKITLDTEDPRFIVKDGPWKGRRVAEIYKENSIPMHWHSIIFEYARKLGIAAFSSPFDTESVQFLDKLGVPAFKVASNEIYDWHLIEMIVKTKKPVLISTGTATRPFLDRTQSFLIGEHCANYAFLYCVSAYPPQYSDMHLTTLADMKNRYSCPIGLSDHSLRNDAAIAAVALGASVIEKHLTLRRSDGGNDAHFSLEPLEFADLVQSVKNAWASTSSCIKYPGERNIYEDGVFMRQLWSKKDINDGEQLSWENIISIRAPFEEGCIFSCDFREVIGQYANGNIAKHEPIKPCNIIK